MIFSRIRRIFQSLKLTILLLVCLAIVFLIGLIVPQKSLLGKESYLAWKAQRHYLVSFLESVGFTDIYTSPIALTLWVFFFTNLIAVMSKRIPAIWRRYKKEDMPERADSLKGGRHYEVIKGVSIEGAAASLKRMGYSVFPGENFFWAVKNRFSPLATIIFHLSFFLLLLGGVTSFYTKFRAETALSVGETFAGRYSSVKAPKIGSIPFTTFKVEDIRPTYYKKDIPVDLKVTLLTEKGTKVIGINKPYREGALSFVVKDIDVSPLFIVKDEKGKEVDGAYVKLTVLKGEEDFFKLAGHNFKVIFYTDILSDIKAELKSGQDTSANLPQALKQMPQGRPGRQQREVSNPAFNIRVYREGKVIGSGTIKMGESMRFDGREILFKDLGYWVKFYVVREYGLGIVYAGFVLIILALTVRFVFYRRDVKGVFEGGNLHITGRAEYFTSLFADEFKKIIRKLRGPGEPP